MKDRSVVRLRKRAVALYSASLPAKRRRIWMIPLSVLVLVAIVIAGMLAFASRSSYAPYGMYYAFAPSNASTDGKVAAFDDANQADSIARTDAYAAAPETSVEPKSNAQSWDRMIIRTATISLTVKEVMSAVDRVNSLAGQHGGYVFSSESHEQGEYTYATVTIYVPAQEFDQVIPTLRSLEGQVEKVTSENVTSSDVTEEYTDLQSQLRNLQATEVRMLDLQTKATTLADVMAVDRELRTVEGDIERIQGRLNFLDKRTEMSTITIQFSPVTAPAPAPQAEPAWQPFEAAVAAWNSSLDLLSKVGTALIVAGVFLWWAVPLALFSIWIVTRTRKKPVAVINES